MNNRIEDIDNGDSDLTNSDGNNKETLNFQFDETDWFQGVHHFTGVPQNKSLVFNQTFENKDQGCSVQT